MADTRDVAEELFEFLTGFKYVKNQVPLAPVRLDSNFMVDRLEWLANDQRIGIEDTRRLVRNGRDEGRPTLAQIERAEWQRASDYWSRRALNAEQELQRHTPTLAELASEPAKEQKD